jgi:hypothetical protein
MNGHKAVRIALLLVVSASLGCGGGGTTPQESIGISNRSTSLTIDPASVTMVPNQQGVIQVIAHFSSGSQTDVTGSATFQSSNTGVVTIAAGGVITAVALGDATVTATYTSGAALSVTLPVTVAAVAPDHIDVTPISLSVEAGHVGQFTARLVASDGTSTDVTQTAAWTSSNTDVFTVIAPGQIRATSDGFVGALGGTATLKARQGIAEGQAAVRVIGRFP